MRQMSKMGQNNQNEAKCPKWDQITKMRQIVQNETLISIMRHNFEVGTLCVKWGTIVVTRQIGLTGTHYCTKKDIMSIKGQNDRNYK